METGNNSIEAGEKQWDEQKMIVQRREWNLLSRAKCTSAPAAVLHKNNRAINLSSSLIRFLNSKVNLFARVEVKTCDWQNREKAK
jgi:hypothetical protein